MPIDISRGLKKYISIFQLAHEQGIKNVLVSNGYINTDPLKKLCKVIDAANIDLKSFSDDIYLRLNAGKLQPI